VGIGVVVVGVGALLYFFTGGDDNGDNLSLPTYQKSLEILDYSNEIVTQLVLFYENDTPSSTAIAIANMIELTRVAFIQNKISDIPEIFDNFCVTIPDLLQQTGVSDSVIRRQLIDELKRFEKALSIFVRPFSPQRGLLCSIL
jgi:hypothetical protein